MVTNARAAGVFAALAHTRLQLAASACNKLVALECTRKAHLQTTLECTSRATCQVRALARTCAPKCALKRRSSMCLSAALR
jgi:hypothetical protein